MFEIIETLMTQLITWIPGLVALYIIFDLVGALLFDKR